MWGSNTTLKNKYWHLGDIQKVALTTLSTNIENICSPPHASLGYFSEFIGNGSARFEATLLCAPWEVGIN